MPPHGDMDETGMPPELHDLVMILLTRIGMIMEDVSPVALDVTPGEIQGRVLIVADASARITALIKAVQALVIE